MTASSNSRRCEIVWTVDLIERDSLYFVRLTVDGQPDLIEERGPFKDSILAASVQHELSAYVREGLTTRLQQIRKVIFSRS